MSATGDALARFAGLLADRSRATVCVALLDGRAWTATELGRHLGLAPSTVSGHLTALVSGGLLVDERQGRHRYVRLAGPDAAQLVEDVAALAGAEASSPTGLRAARVSRELAAARTCYDHLAGHLGVAVLDAMVVRDLVSVHDGVALTPAGKQLLLDLGGRLDDGSRRPVARTCLDWTERRHHLGGQVGAVLLDRFLAHGWVRRRPDSRAVTVTGAGRGGLGRLLGPGVVA